MAPTAAACTPDAPTARLVHEHFGQSGAQSMDLGAAVPAPWERVCIVGPYMNNAQTRATLGFAWDSEQVSDIASDDGKVLLVFVGGSNQVAFHLPYPARTAISATRPASALHARTPFSSMSRSQRTGGPACFPRRRSQKGAEAARSGKRATAGSRS